MGEERAHSSGVREKSLGVENPKIGDRLRSTEAAVVRIPDLPEDDICAWLEGEETQKVTADQTIRYPWEEALAND